MEKRRTAYKGFDKDLKCIDFQYEVGKEYEHQGDVSLCCAGFHACENPFDVLDYYDDILNNRYCVVEQFGETERDDKKSVSSKIAIKAEIGFTGLFKAGIEYIKEITNPEKADPTKGGRNINDRDRAQIGSSGDCAQIGSSGDCAQIGSSGYCAQIGSSGDRAQIGSSGDCAQIGSSGYCAKIDSSGEYSVICCTGNRSMVKAKVGSWITLAEWELLKSTCRYVPKCVKTEYVDGERIKADTWYMLKDGEFYEVKD